MNFKNNPNLEAAISWKQYQTQRPTNCTRSKIEKLLVVKQALEESCEDKNWEWNRTRCEHQLLEQIDYQLINLGYF